MKVYRYPGGWTLAVGRHRWDYWAPGCWVPLRFRGRVRYRWWGALTYEPITAADPAPAGPAGGGVELIESADVARPVPCPLGLAGCDCTTGGGLRARHSYGAVPEGQRHLYAPELVSPDLFETQEGTTP